MKAESHYFKTRQEALREQLAARRLQFLVVSHPPNVFYLTGFRGSAGAAIFGLASAALLVDPRYTIQARRQASGIEVREVKVGLAEAVGAWLKARRVGRIGFEDEHVTVNWLHRLRNAGPAGAKWAPAGPLVEELRTVKDDSEIQQIRKACELTAAAFSEFQPLVRPGASELDLAAELDFRIRGRGAEGPAFETIVASGPRTAWPHARPSAKALKRGEFVIFDVGAILGGYAADMTRTLYLGEPGRRARSLYEAVQSSYDAACAELHAGAAAGEVDAAARNSLARHRLSRYFTHSTGHGVGVEIHERPRLARGVETRIPVGSVVTVEPGIYLEGRCGIRIEDTLLVTRGGAEVLTPAPKDCWFTG